MLKARDLPPHLRQRMGIKAPSKYGVADKSRRTADGIVFDSRKEMLRYLELKRMQASGEARYFLRQVPFHLPGGVKYLVDFMVVWKCGMIDYEDVKGVRTAIFKLKKRQVEALYPVTIREI